MGSGADGLTTETRKELARLKREIKRLQMKRDIPKGAVAWSQVPHRCVDAWRLGDGAAHAAGADRGGAERSKTRRSSLSHRSLPPAAGAFPSSLSPFRPLAPNQNPTMGPTRATT